MAEAFLNHVGSKNFQAFSAGSHPIGKVHPITLQILKDHAISTQGLYSKSWEELKDISFKLIITVCDDDAGESCPIFPTSSLKIHWGVPNPATFVGTIRETQAHFEDIFAMLRVPIKSLIHLPQEDMLEDELLEQIKEIKLD